MCEVEGTEVIRLVEQFFLEQGLPKAAAALQAETGVAPAALDSARAARLRADIAAGRWDAVLAQTAALELPEDAAGALHEHVVLELAAQREREAARAVLAHSRPLQRLAARDPPRYRRLERAASAPAFDLDEHLAAAAVTPAARRAQLATLVADSLAAARPARLLELLGKGLRYEAAEHHASLAPQQQQQQQQSPAATVSGPVDLLGAGVQQHARRENGETPADAAATAGSAADERVPCRLVRAVKVDADSHVECACWAAGGRVATGSVDGFVELWDGAAGVRDAALAYQQREEYLVHGAGVLAAAFSADGDALATGDAAGTVCVWAVRTGRRLRELRGAHSAGVTCLAFGADATELVSGAFDNTARTHGLRAGRTLRVFRGHTAVVNSVLPAHAGARLVTAASDGTVRCWDAHTAQCLAVLRTDTLVPAATVATTPGAPPAALCLRPIPPGSSSSSSGNSSTVVLVGLRLAAACTVDVDTGRVVRVFAHPAAASRGSSSEPPAKARRTVAATGAAQAAAVTAEGCGRQDEFVAWAVSPGGAHVYCATEGGVLHCFDTHTGAHVETVELGTRSSDGALIGIAAHPCAPGLVSWTDRGAIKFWAAS